MLDILRPPGMCILVVVQVEYHKLTRDVFADFRKQFVHHSDAFFSYGLVLVLKVNPGQQDGLESFPQRLKDLWSHWFDIFDAPSVDVYGVLVHLSSSFLVGQLFGCKRSIIYLSKLL